MVENKTKYEIARLLIDIKEEIFQREDKLDVIDYLSNNGFHFDEYFFGRLEIAPPNRID